MNKLKELQFWVDFGQKTQDDLDRMRTKTREELEKKLEEKAFEYVDTPIGYSPIIVPLTFDEQLDAARVWALRVVRWFEEDSFEKVESRITSEMTVYKRSETELGTTYSGGRERTSHIDRVFSYLLDGLNKEKNLAKCKYQRCDKVFVKYGKVKKEFCSNKCASAYIREQKAENRT